VLIKSAEVVSLKVKGLPPATNLKVKLALPDRKVVLGRVQSNASGKAILPGFSISDAGTYIVTLKAGKANYVIKVVVS
jgi:hypothetical protein